MIKIGPISYLEHCGESFSNGPAQPGITSALCCFGCFAPTGPPPVNYGQQTRDTLQAQVDLAPQLYANEARYQPQYSDLMLRNLNQMLQGAPAGTQTVSSPATASQTGWYSPTGEFINAGSRREFTLPGRNGNPAYSFAYGRSNQQGAPPSPGAVWRTQGSKFNVDTTQNVPATPGLTSIMAGQNTAQRTADIGDVTALGPQARAAILGANPDQAALLEKLNAQANEGLDAGSMLSADETRAMQQASRAAFASRGMGGSNASISDELLRQFNLGQQLLRQRQMFAQSVLGNNAAVVGDPFMQILGRGSNALSNAAGLQQQSGPGLFNPESPLSGSITAGNQAYRAMFANPSTIDKIGGVMNLGGKLVGGIASAMGGGI